MGLKTNTTWILIASLGCFAFVLASYSLKRDGSIPVGTLPAQSIKKTAAVVQPIPQDGINGTIPLDAMSGLSWVPSYQDLSVSDCCHLLRAYGEGPIRGGAFSSGNEILRFLLNDEAGAGIFGGAVLSRTRSGIRFSLSTANSAGESHRDQCLATFAEMGLPLTTPVVIGAETYTLNDLLADSLANFHLRQEEICWTAIAYALYLPGGSTWENRYGNAFGLDDLASELLRRPLQESSCAGTHLLYSMALLHRLNHSGDFLAPKIGLLIQERLAESVAEQIARQEPSGFWELDDSIRTKPLFRENPEMDTLHWRLVLTGHHMEWMLLLPEDMQPPQETFFRSLQWLQTVSVKIGVDSLSLRDEKKLVCPRTHAWCVCRSLLN